MPAPSSKTDRAAIQGRARPFSHRIGRTFRLHRSIQREASERAQASLADLVVAIGRLAADAAELHLREGEAGSLIRRQLRPLQREIARSAAELPTASRRHLVFLYSQIWNQEGAAWSEAAFGSSEEGTRTYYLFATLARFERVRRESVGKEGERALLGFLAEESVAIPYLPKPHRQLLAGLVRRLPESDEKAAHVAEAERHVGETGPGEGDERARTDRLLQSLDAVVRAYGISKQAGGAVAAALATPEIFRVASTGQLVVFVASARAAGDDRTVKLIVELAPKDARGSLVSAAKEVRQFHWDLQNWALGNIRRGGPIEAWAQVQELRGKGYWGRSVPYYGAIEERKALVHAIEETLVATPTPTSGEVEKQRAIRSLREAREEIIRTASSRDAAELAAAKRTALVETERPEVAANEAFLAELAGAVGADPEIGRKLASGELLLVAFRRLCEVAGIDAEALITAFQKGKKALQLLIEDPPLILRFLVGAIRGAFELLRKNFGKLLIGGLVGFLTGAVAGGEVEPPKRWNPTSTAGFLLQLAGVTVKRVWQLVAKILGPKRADRVERAAGSVMALFTGERSSVLEKLQGRIAEIKETALAALKTWLVESVLGRFLVKLAAMFSPVGAIITAITTIASLVQLIQSWSSRIAEVVRSIFDSLVMIAEGKVKPAAQAIYTAIAGIFPVVIGLIAGFVFGNTKLLQNLGKALQAVGEKLWGIVVKIVQAALAPFKKVAKKGRELVAGAAEWWKRKRRFKTLDGLEHTLFFRGEGRRAELVVASEPVESLRKLVEQHGDKLGHLRPHVLWFERLSASASDTLDERTDEEIGGRLKAIAEELEKAGVPKGGQPPPTKVSWKMNKGRAKKVVAEPLTIHAGNTVGEKADRTRVRGLEVIERWTTKTPYEKTRIGKSAERSPLEAVHLLAEKLHGPATPWNMSFATATINGGMRGGPERRAKDLLQKEPSARLRYDVDVYYHKNREPGDEPMEAEEASLEGKRGWVGFYVARKFDVTIKRFDGEGYEPIEKGRFKPADRHIPNIAGAPVEPDTAAVFSVLSAHASTAAEDEHQRDNDVFARVLKDDRSLTQELEISPSFYQKAVKLLRAEGKVYVKQAMGTFVRTDRPLRKTDKEKVLDLLRTYMDTNEPETREGRVYYRVTKKHTELADELGFNLPRFKSSIHTLIRDKLIFGKPGVGTYTTKPGG